MGILVLLLGLAAAGVLADVAVQNDPGLAPKQAVDVFGQTLHLSNRELVVAGAILGAAAVLLVAAGLALLGMRLGRRRDQQAARQDLEKRTEHLTARARLLESQNAALSQENAALKLRAEELERAAGPAGSEGFGPPSGQVAETALIAPPPPPEPPLPREEVRQSS
jgi:uncharacterized protein HemX